ncbi:hypothetical protein JL720_5699 [Aureococcus anophagefferens]|nr:hypothetical protein JL720_5699 [Aureococcus anophagefferens]
MRPRRAPPPAAPRRAGAGAVAGAPVAGAGAEARNGTRRGGAGAAAAGGRPRRRPRRRRASDAASFPFSRGAVRRGNVQRPVRASSRKFRAGPRKDLENFVAPLLRRMGLLETKGMDWDCYVGLQFTPEHEHNYLLAPAEPRVVDPRPQGGPRRQGGVRGSGAAASRARALSDAALRRRPAAGLCAWTTPAFNAVHKLVDGAPRFAVEGGVDLCANQPASWDVLTKLQNSLARFFELRLGEAPPLSGEAAWAAWQAELWPARRTALLPLLLAKDELHGHEARVYGARDGELSRRSKRFALLSPSALGREIGGWRLEEINTNGLFQLGADEGEDVRTFHVDEGAEAAPDRRRRRLPARRPRRPRRRGARRLLRARGCDGRDREVLAAAAHENAHASSGWYRAWPPVDCGDACGGRQDDAASWPSSRAATRAGRLHFDFLRSLDRAYFASPSAARPDDGDRGALRRRPPDLALLVLNAGVMRPAYGVVGGGAEATVASNHLGHFLLAELLGPTLAANAARGRDCRVVVVSSSLHRVAARALDALPDAAARRAASPTSGGARGLFPLLASSS